MMQQNKERIVSVLAIILGLLSIKEGGSVLLGISAKAYPVLPWLVWYNVVLGFVAVTVGIGIWIQQNWGARHAITILTLHGFVFMILIILLAFKETVAINSILAMLFRTTVWLTIVLLLRRKSKMQNENG
jgi:hypothetical protein